jgi:FtsP/CotA-like multicopper oxidase with cupredoxin domain
MSYQKTLRKSLIRLVAGLVLAVFLAPPSFAADIYLVAKGFTKTMPDAEIVPMWGFATDADGILDTVGDETPTAPGPPIELSGSDTVLNIHVRNDLTDAISIIIPGQPTDLNPVRFTDSLGRSRVSSFTDVTLPDGGQHTYSWTNVRPGTFIYQSGSHPSVQVPMGLYGAMKKDAAPGNAYFATPYTKDEVIFLSEIDPVLNSAVTDGKYGTVDYPSTLNYKPSYFLVNGEPFDSAATGLSTIAAGNVSDTILLRFLNAGLMTHVPTIDGLYMDIIAEDGNLYPYPKDQYSLLLPAGKTIDAILKQKETGLYPIYDRRLYLTSAAVTNGGMLNYLEVSSTVGAPVALNDAYAVDEEATLTVLAPAGVLFNDSDPDTDPLSAVLVTDVTNGSLTLNADGSLAYTPAVNFNGTDIFEYEASDGALTSNLATALITVNPINDAPDAVDDTVDAAEGVAIVIDVLANDDDVDGDTLVVTGLTQPISGATVLNVDNTVTYTPIPGYLGAETFTYTANDSIVDGNVATVTVTVNPHVNILPVAEDDYVSTSRNTPVTFDITSNDSDSDGTIDNATVVFVTDPTRGGAVVSNGDGTITFTPKKHFKGTDVFTYTVNDNVGGTSNEATVRVNVIK